MFAKNAQEEMPIVVLLVIKQTPEHYYTSTQKLQNAFFRVDCLIPQMMTHKFAKILLGDS